MIDLDGQDSMVLQLTMAGHAAGRAGEQSIRTGPGDLIVLDLTRPLSLADEGPREGLSIILPRDRIAAVHPEPSKLHGLVLGPERNGLLADYLRALLPRLPVLPNTAGLALSRVVVELFAVVLERPLAEEPTVKTAEFDALDRQRLAVLAYIDASLSDPNLDPSSVATEFGLSRSTLYKLFETSGGVAQHIWRRRLAAVHQALISTDERRSIGDLAFAWGFASESHFGRAFRAAYGRSPRQLRREALGRG